MPGHVIKQCSGFRHVAGSTANPSPRAQKRHRTKGNNQGGGRHHHHHHHRSVTKTQSANVSTSLASKSRWAVEEREEGHQMSSPNHIVYNRENMPEFATFKTADITNKIEEKINKNVKKHLHKTKSDFVRKNDEATNRKDIPIKPARTLSNIPNSTNNANTITTHNVPTKTSNIKPPLKKSNTFPYETLYNDTTSYSSDNESLSCGGDDDNYDVDATANNEDNDTLTSDKNLAAYHSNGVSIDKQSIMLHHEPHSRRR